MVENRLIKQTLNFKWDFTEEESSGNLIFYTTVVIILPVFNILSEHFFFFFFFFKQKRYFGSGLMKNYIKTILGGSKGIFQKICKLLGIKTSCQESPPTPQNVFLTLSWRRSLSYRHQVIDLLCKSIDWFLYH